MESSIWVTNLQKRKL